jgi:Domain of unknown function (DUF4266)
MLRIMLWVSLGFLSACGHYQNLKDNSTRQHSSSNNRYSQNNIVLINSAKKTQKNHNAVAQLKASQVKASPVKVSQVKKPIVKRIKIRQASDQNKSLAKTKTAKNKEPQSHWEKLLNLFTPEKVKPWQKAILAKASMKPGGLNPDSEKFNQKIYSSKESSRGGLGVAGGGCGCN